MDCWPSKEIKFRAITSPVLPTNSQIIQIAPASYLIPIGPKTRDMSDSTTGSFFLIIRGLLLRVLHFTRLRPLRREWQKRTQVSSLWTISYRLSVTWGSSSSLRQRMSSEFHSVSLSRPGRPSCLTAKLRLFSSDANEARQSWTSLLFSPVDDAFVEVHYSMFLSCPENTPEA